MTDRPDYCYRCDRPLTEAEFIERHCNCCGKSPMRRPTTPTEAPNAKRAA
jgi:hypothetical protein